MSDVTNIVSQIPEVNVPTIKTDTIAFLKNEERGLWAIQNLSVNPLYICLGSDASEDSFHFVLSGGSSEDDGTGGHISQAEGVVYSGEITVYGEGKRYTTMEI